MIAAEGLEFFWSSWVNAPVIQHLCKDTALCNQDETGMEFGLLHSMLPAPARGRGLVDLGAAVLPGQKSLLGLSHVIPSIIILGQLF